MNLARTSGTLGLATLAVFASPFAVAADAADDTGWYGGLNVGQSRAKIDDPRIRAQLLGQGLTSSIVDDDRDTGYKFFGGYQINKNFALEGGYFRLGTFGFTATTVPPGTLVGTSKYQGLNFDAVGILPITEKFSAFGRIGVAYTEAKDNFTRTLAVPFPLIPSPSKRAANYKFGLGLQYAFTESLGARLEAERYRVDDAVGNKGDIDLISVGLIYRFGAKTPAPAPRAAAPEPIVAAAPAPKPVVTPPPPPPPVVVTPPPKPRVPTKVTFSADSLFDFDKAVMKPEGKQHLDKFAADLRGVDYDVITVTGHTDRIGAHEYNMKLSTRRADAVKAYLAETGGLPAGKITAIGKDGADPVTKPADCKGTKATKTLIACLQPDRRVEIEVHGTK